MNLGKGELLPGLPYLRNWSATYAVPRRVNYYLDYRTSETSTSRRAARPEVNYYLDYRTSETIHGITKWMEKVNYYLDYRTSETEQ